MFVCVFCFWLVVCYAFYLNCIIIWWVVWLFMLCWFCSFCSYLVVWLDCVTLVWWFGLLFDILFVCFVVLCACFAFFVFFDVFLFVASVPVAQW